MIYQLVIKRTKILAIATSHIAHIRNYYNHAFALLMSVPRFNSINFYQNKPKIKLCLPKKLKIFRAIGALPPDSRASCGWGLLPYTSVTTSHCIFLDTRLTLLNLRH